MGNRCASVPDREIYNIIISGSEKVRHRKRGGRLRACSACRTSVAGCSKHHSKLTTNSSKADTPQNEPTSQTPLTCLDPMRGYTSTNNGSIGQRVFSGEDAPGVADTPAIQHDPMWQSVVTNADGYNPTTATTYRRSSSQPEGRLDKDTNSGPHLIYTRLPPVAGNNPLETEARSSLLPGRDKEHWLRYPYPQENLVLSGGGSKGYAFVGSLKALEDCGVLARMKRIAGSSVGSICAGLLAVGCSPQEIADVFALDVKWLFHDQPCQCCCCVPNIVKKFGVHPARRFYDIYGSSIADKYDNPDLTFKQLYDLSGRELCIVVTNLTRMCSEYCHYTTTPDLPIRLAVRMSMAFPNGKLDVNENQTSTNLATLGLYVISECAIDYKIWQSIFSREIPYKPSYVPDTKLARARLKEKHPTFKSRKRRESGGSKLQQRLRHLAASVESLFKWPEEMTEINIKTFADFMSTTFETVLANQRKLTVKPSDVERTIPINCGYIGTNDYIIEPGDREFMIKQGYECTRQFLLDFIKKEEDQRLSMHSEVAPRSQKAPCLRTNSQPAAPNCQPRTMVRSASRETQV